MIKNIVFDVGNVMEYYRWQDLMRDLGFKEEVIQKLKTDMIMSKEWAELDRGVIPEKEVINGFKERNKGLEKEIDLFFENIDKVVNEYDYTQSWLKDLKKEGYKLYYLSNYPTSLFKIHSEKVFTFLPLMDGGIVSAHVKLIKPDHKIYECLFDKYNLDPKECVFIDDTEKNIVGAREVGMKGIVFKDYEDATKKLHDILMDK